MPHLFTHFRKWRRLPVLALLLSCALSACPASWQHYSEWMAASEMARVPHSYNLDFSPNVPRWSYQVGVELDGMYDVFLTYGNEDLGRYVSEYPATMVGNGGTIYGYRYDDYNLDNVRPGHFLLRFYQHQPSDRLLMALNLLMSQLENQPRTNDGVWWHKAIYARQVWLDGIFMGLPFYTAAAPVLHTGNELSYYDDAVNQITTTDQRTWDEQTRLWKHAWDETHAMFWANPQTGLSQHSWARAMGWFVMAMVEILDVLPADYERRGEVEALFLKAMTSLAEYQDVESGVWYDVLDVDDPRNYLEATASAMFTYCMLKGWRKGWLPQHFLNEGIRAYRGMIEQFVVENADGTISLTKCCSVSGLGPENNPRRDGSFEYYISEPIRDNDAKGIGPFLWASLEMERMGFTVDNLFTFNPSRIDAVRAEPSSVVYDMQGRRFSGHSRGIVIKNGRKILFK